MYICVCNAVTDSDIRKAVDNGVCSLGQLKQATGCGTTCGCCKELTIDVLQQALTEKRDSQCMPLGLQMA
jgi:bacterioferritin-associated ferredoxin